MILPLKRPSSLSRPGTAISDPKVGEYYGISDRYKLSDPTYIILYPPRTWRFRLPLRLGKRSNVSLEGAASLGWSYVTDSCFVVASQKHTERCDMLAWS